VHRWKQDLPTFQAWMKLKYFNGDPDTPDPDSKKSKEAAGVGCEQPEQLRCPSMTL
jgi:hypothetical protein